MGRKRLIRIITVAAAVLAVAAAFYIMVHGLGLSDRFDFGAGAYYYADIPGFETLLKDDLYKSPVPFWVHLVLFLSWGWLMWRLWVRIEQKGKK